MAYFKARDYILKGKQVIEEKPDFSKIDGNVSKGKLYKDVDNDGDTYYYRGAVEDNYFKFGNKFYRIIRINGNGSIRLIYDGSKAYANGDISNVNDRAIGENDYSSKQGDNKYVGFRYETNIVHGFKEPSTVLGADTSPASGTLNKWYESTILNTDLEKYIDKEEGFICDRTNSTSSSTTYENMTDNGGTGTKATYYGAYARLVNSKSPIFKYKNENDYFTTKNVKKGNKSLIYPVGLITADEIAYAGGIYNVSNRNYYLYTGSFYWAMSPFRFENDYVSTAAYGFYMYNTGYLYGAGTKNSIAVRPVINILGSVNLIGDGTMDNPYEITEPVIHHKLAKNGEIIQGIAKNGEKWLGIAHAGEIIWKYEESKPKYPTPEEAPFATATDEQISQVLEAYYKGLIDINDYWKVGDTRVMHLSAMPSGTGASEKHVAQNMTMVIIGIEHDKLQTSINGKTKAAITLQCKELLGNNGNAEYAYIWGSSTSTASDSNYSKNPRRTWLNGTFVNSLPNYVQSLVKTVVKKNIANHSSNPGAGPDTEDKAFLTSYPEMFGSASYSYYKGSVALEGEQYSYYSSNAKRTKYWNNNGTASSSAYPYWLRSPSSYDSYIWIDVTSDGSALYYGSYTNIGLAPAFCL